MPVSSDLVRVSIGEEAAADYGSGTSLPATFYELPISSEGVMSEVQTSLSTLQSETRQVLDSLLDLINAQGSINSEMVLCPAFELLLGSAMANAVEASPAPVVGEDPSNMKKLKVGETQKSLVIVKRFPDPDPAATPGVDYIYHIITGAVVNTLSVTTSPGSPINYVANLIAKEYVTGKTGDTGIGEGGIYDIADVAAATAVTDPVVLRSPDVVNLEFGGAPLADAVLARCFGEFGFELNNNYRGIQCIGSVYNQNVAIGRCEVSMNASIHFHDNDILDALKQQTEHDFTFRAQKVDSPITDFEGMFSTYFPRMKIASDSVVAGGTGSDVVDDVTMNALYDSTDASTLIMSWGDGAVA